MPRELAWSDSTKYPCVAKPKAYLSGQRTLSPHLLLNSRDYEVFLETERQDDFYLQEFVEGPPGSVNFVAAGGRGVVLGITRQLVGDAAFGSSGFRYCGNILLKPQDVVPDATALVDAVAAEFSLAGVGSIDVIASAHGLQPVEVNPRWSASMELVERARGISMFALHADACAKGTLPEFDVSAPSEQGVAHGKAIVFAREDLVVGDTRAWLDDPTVRDVPREGDEIAAGQPICTVLATGSGYDSCYAKLLERADVVYRLLT